MQHVIQPGDTLWRLAARYFGDAEKWPLLVQDNPGIIPRQLLVGDPIAVRASAIVESSGSTQPGQQPPPSAANQSASLIPGRAFLFVLADEVNPVTRKVVRKVMVNPRMAEAWSRRIGKPIPVVPNPETFGLMPTDVASPVSAGRHAMGMKPSAFTSASEHPLGSPRFSGSRFWIDVERARAAGATFHETEHIIADLTRIASKTKDPAQLIKINGYKQIVLADGEVLLRGAVPAAAVKGTASMVLTRGLQGVQVVGFVMTAVDLGNAANQSVKAGSVKPIAAETIRQAGGWAAAWAGVKLGAAAGAALGIETGPGAVLTGAAGGVVGGVAGYCGFDWVADHIWEN